MVSIRIFDLQKLGQGHELQHCIIHCWMPFHGLQDDGKNDRLISSHFPLVHQWDIRTHTWTRTHTPMIAIGGNAVHCISPKNCMVGTVRVEENLPFTSVLILSFDCKCWNVTIYEIFAVLAWTKVIIEYVHTRKSQNI